MRGATSLAFPPRPPGAYFNPRSSCEERRLPALKAHLDVQISIHAPHARSDTSSTWRLPSSRFQSTLLMRGTTSACLRSRRLLANFNPRSSCEERPARRRSAYGASDFNPRSSCEERPGNPRRRAALPYDFNPRSSCEERLSRQARPAVRSSISIHAPHARSDPCCFRGCRQPCHFNPRSSCEERPLLLSSSFVEPLISIHAPHARSDLWRCIPPVRARISIHAPHARSDW